MAAADDPGGLRPHPPGRCPGPRPSSEMARQVRTGTAGGHLLAGRGTGAAEPPPRSRAPPASQAMTLRVTLDQPGGTRGAKRVPDEEMPSLPPEGGLAGSAATRRGHQDSAAGQMFDKHKAENDQPAVLSGDGTVEDNGHPDESIWGESSLHQTRGVPSTGGG